MLTDGVSSTPRRHRLLVLAANASFHGAMRSRSPPHRRYRVGMVYRAAPGETALPAARTIGAGLTCGPVMALATAAWRALGELARLANDPVVAARATHA